MKKIRSILLFCTACFFSSAFAQTPQIDKPWVRASIAGSSVSAAYMQIKSAEPLKLVKVESPVAGLVEMHSMAVKNGVMEMRAVDAIDIAANKTTELKSGGYHIMLMKLNKTIAAGDKIPLTLTFENKEKKSMKVMVEALAQQNEAHQHHAH